MSDVHSLPVLMPMRRGPQDAARIGIKTGAVGGERTAKLNELIRIEEEL